MHKKIFYLHVIINAKQDGCESTLAGIESQVFVLKCENICTGPATGEEYVLCWYLWKLTWYSAL